jgi:hypothetical protein
VKQARSEASKQERRRFLCDAYSVAGFVYRRLGRFHLPLLNINSLGANFQNFQKLSVSRSYLKNQKPYSRLELRRATFDF